MKSGTIIKINIKDFVTYSNVEICPGPNLNIILGPNGTGKSTIVAALILGLGGTPKTIGRGTKVSEYIRNYCSESRIEIILQGYEESQYTVTRVFNLSNHNTWYLNGKPTTEHQIKNLVCKLNVQIDNLCQFLPQDRVQDFARMDKKELLINTQQALGRQDLVDKHVKLIEIRNDQKIIVKEIESLCTTVEQTEAEVFRLEGKIQNLNEKKNFLIEIDHIKRKICCQNYYEYLEDQRNAEKDLEKAKHLLDEKKKEIGPFENEINKKRKIASAIQTLLLKCRTNISDAERNLKKLFDDNENLWNNRKLIIIEMKNKIKSISEHQNEIDIIKLKIDKLINDEKSLTEQFGNDAEIDSKAEVILKQSKKYLIKCEEINKEKISVMHSLGNSHKQLRLLEDSLTELDNINNIRLNKLYHRDKDAYNAVLWLRKNRHIFHYRVYEPMILELNVVNVNHSKYLENIISMRDSVAFTCENRNDMNLLLQRVREEIGYCINVVHSGAEHPPLSYYKPLVPLERISCYGFFAYTNSLISGPEAIIKYLCRMYMIHNIPIGDKSTYNKASKVPQNIRLFFSESNRFSVSVSRYTGEKSTRIIEIRSKGTFSNNIDLEKMKNIKKDINNFQQLHEKMKNKIEQFEKQVKILETKQEEKIKERQELYQNKDHIKNIRDRIAASSRSLKTYLLNHQSRENIEQESHHKLLDIVKKSQKLQKAISNAFLAFDEGCKKEQIINLEYNVIQKQIINIENRITNLRCEYEEAQSIYKKIESHVNKLKRKTEDALQEVQQLSDGLSPEDREFVKFERINKRLPSNVSKLNDMICDYKTKIECILTADDGEREAYANGKIILTKCQSQLANKKIKLNMLNEKLETLHQEWIEPLKTFIEKINRNFSDYFEAMDCAGEVVLSYESGIQEYADYGLNIRVTYRAGEPLQELNQHVQSGGERAVATAVYMISMQDLTAAPFRCVDEINQGMDVQNERRILEILVKATGKVDTCQYFLITPKLVPALQFGKATEIHIVHNGPYNKLESNFNINTFIKSKKTT